MVRIFSNPLVMQGILLDIHPYLPRWSAYRAFCCKPLTSGLSKKRFFSGRQVGGGLGWVVLSVRRRWMCCREGRIVPRRVCRAGRERTRYGVNRASPPRGPRLCHHHHQLPACTGSQRSVWRRDAATYRGCGLRGGEARLEQARRAHMLVTSLRLAWLSRRGVAFCGCVACR